MVYNMILERLCRVIYESDRRALYNVAGKSIEEIFESYKMAVPEDKKKIIGLVDQDTRDKITAMTDGGLL